MSPAHLQEGIHLLLDSVHEPPLDNEAAGGKGQQLTSPHPAFIPSCTTAAASRRQGRSRARSGPRGGRGCCCCVLDAFQNRGTRGASSLIEDLKKVRLVLPSPLHQASVYQSCFINVTVQRKGKVGFEYKHNWAYWHIHTHTYVQPYTYFQGEYPAQHM